MPIKKLLGKLRENRKSKQTNKQKVNFTHQLTNQLQTFKKSNWWKSKRSEK